MSNNILQASKNIHALASKSQKACVSALNKATTKMLGATLDDMESQIPISRTRLKKQVKRLSRATVNDLSSGVMTKHRGILLHNFPHITGKDGVSVKVTRSGGFKTIKGAYIGKKPLRNSGVTGYIAMRAGDLIRILEKGKRSEKINKRIATLKTKNQFAGIPLNSTSEAQMMFDIKEERRLDKVASQTFTDEFILRIKD